MKITKRSIKITNYKDFNGVAFAVSGIVKKSGKQISFVMRKDEFKNEFGIN